MPFDFKIDKDGIGHIKIFFDSANNKTIFRDLDLEDTFNWKEGIIDYPSSCMKKCYLVLYSIDHKNYNIILKPKKKYEEYEFERLFGFKGKCSDYNENKIIAIVNCEGDI